MTRNKQILNIMGIDIWQQRPSFFVTQNKTINNKSRDHNATTLVEKTSPNWEQLKQKVKTCQNCILARTRKNTVFGTGSEHANLMVIGEAPGFHEDQQGKPFVGRAGQLLTSMLEAIGYSREEVFIANVLKCRPPNNRDPKGEEVDQCTSYLQQQIAHIKPKAILAVGRIAAQYLLKTDLPMRSLRGQRYFYTDDKIPLFITYHPAYLLRSPIDKTKAFTDLLTLQRALS